MDKTANTGASLYSLAHFVNDLYDTRSIILKLTSVAIKNLFSQNTTCISNQHYKPGEMFRFTEPSTDQFLKQSIFSDCPHYGIPYYKQYGIP